MPVRRTPLLLGVAAAALIAGCDVPFAPRWDADMYMPLSTQPIHLDAIAAFALGAIPPGISDTVSFPPQRQDVSGALESVLTQLTDSTRCTDAANPALSCNQLMLTVTKTTAIEANDTLFVAPDSASLFAPADPAVPNTSAAGGILLPVLAAASDTLVADTIQISQASMRMLQAAGNTTHELWVQFRGQVGNPGLAPITLTSADSIGISLAITVRVAVSHR